MMNYEQMVTRAVEDFKNKLEESQCNGVCKNIQFKKVIKEGKPSDVILKTIDEEGVDQVIMGKSGKHGLEIFITWSNNSQSSKRCKCAYFGNILKLFMFFFIFYSF